MKNDVNMCKLNCSFQLSTFVILCCGSGSESIGIKLPQPDQKQRLGYDSDYGYFREYRRNTFSIKVFAFCSGSEGLFYTF